ncbi:MAG: hypothetical protein IPM16_16215 [Chloroflexi bacterium]|nr:hypothetical protein [Chloroflexota bacterium]
MQDIDAASSDAGDSSPESGGAALALGRRTVRLDLRLAPRTVGLLLGGLAVFFGAQSLVAEYLAEVVLDEARHPYFVLALDLFSVNVENSIPTWYSALLLFGASVLLLWIAVSRRKSGLPGTLLWFGLALVFLYLSIDEAASIHEIFAEWLQTDFDLSGFLTFGWQLAALPPLVLFALVYIRFWLRLPASTRTLFLVAAVVYVGGAFVIEGISASMYGESGVTYPYLIVATIEETFEMLGAVILIYALLRFAFDNGYAVSFSPIPASPVGLLPIRRMRPIALGALALVVVNVVVILAAFALTGGARAGGPSGAYQYQTLVDQLAIDGIAVVRTAGQFRLDEPPDPLIVRLADVFPDLMAISLVTSDMTLTLAGDPLPITQAEVIDALHANGETQFVIYDDSAVRLLIQRSTSP